MSLKESTSISPLVRNRVYQRDAYDGRPCCVKCGNPYGVEVHHYIERSRGGMGIEENLVCLCTRCHQHYHNTGDKELKEFIKTYLSNKYEGWDEKKLIKEKSW